MVNLNAAYGLTNGGERRIILGFVILRDPNTAFIVFSWTEFAKNDIAGIIVHPVLGDQIYRNTGVEPITHHHCDYW